MNRTRKYRCHVCDRVKPSPATEFRYVPTKSRRCKKCGSIVDRIYPMKQKRSIVNEVAKVSKSVDRKIIKESRTNSVNPLFVMMGIIISMIILMAIFGGN